MDLLDRAAETVTEVSKDLLYPLKRDPSQFDKSAEDERLR